MLCPKCHALTRTRRIRIDLRGYIFRRRKCKRGHWFDTKDWGYGERLVGDVVDLGELVRRYQKAGLPTAIGQSKEKNDIPCLPVLSSERMEHSNG